MKYVFDTNLWVDVSRGVLSCRDLQAPPGSSVVLSPLVIIELVNGVVQGGEEKFTQNRSMVRCMTCAGPEILELPRVFVETVIWNVPRDNGRVRPEHYRILLDMLAESASHADFLQRTEAVGSVWTRLSSLGSIHHDVLQKELKAMEIMAGSASLSTLHVHMARLYACGGLFPDPDWFQDRFSAAVEYLRTWVRMVRNGANPRKNNRGIYLDSQHFWYLADPKLVLVSNEDFSDELRESPQRVRVISLEAFRRSQH